VDNEDKSNIFIQKIVRSMLIKKDVQIIQLARIVEQVIKFLILKFPVCYFCKILGLLNAIIIVNL